MSPACAHGVRVIALTPQAGFAPVEGVIVVTEVIRFVLPRYRLVGDEFGTVPDSFLGNRDRKYLAYRVYLDAVL